LMPQLGETVTEGKITQWFKSAGDSVTAGDNLFEIETDKTSMEVPATAAGTLTVINVDVGEVASVGAVVAVISAVGDGDKAPSTPAVVASHVAQAPVALQLATVQVQKAVNRSSDGPDLRQRADERPAMQSARAYLAFAQRDPFNVVMTPDRNFGPARVGTVAITPLARRIASERGIDLARLIGSGPHG